MNSEDASILLLRFNRLMRDLRAGTPSRNSYHPWEVEILLDLDSCSLPAADRERVLDRYQRAVRRSLESGAGPLKMSEYLARLPKARAEDRVGECDGAARADAGPDSLGRTGTG